MFLWKERDDNHEEGTGFFFVDNKPEGAGSILDEII
jgi:hypothetical protein